MFLALSYLGTYKYFLSSLLQSPLNPLLQTWMELVLEYGNLTVGSFVYLTRLRSQLMSA